MSAWLHGRRGGTSIDPMLQSERTAMAWQRTALGVGAIGAVLVHSGSFFSAVVGALGLIVALALLVLTERRYERIMRKVQGGEPASHPALMLAMSAVVVLLAIAALALVVLPSD
jgi:uncharacterized membrane protein YidH (DUF202 family)